MRRFVPRRLTPILLYHRIGDIGRLSRSYLRPELLERQLGYIRESGRKVVDMAELVDGMRAGRGAPRGAIAITFDDGWSDNHALAFPIIRRYGVPVTIFLVSGRIGLSDYLSWGQIREMRSEGISFGAHSVSHPRLTEISPADARREIVDCKKALQDGLGEEVPLFCYPYGYFNRAVRDIVAEAGYRGACCNAPGRLWLDDDIFALKRVAMTYRMKNRAAIMAALSGYYVFFKELRTGDKEYIKKIPNPNFQIPNKFQITNSKG